MSIGGIRYYQFELLSAMVGAVRHLLVGMRAAFGNASAQCPFCSRLHPHCNGDTGW
jgi:hypothetical protein